MTTTNNPLIWIKRMWRVSNNKNNKVNGKGKSQLSQKQLPRWLPDTDELDERSGLEEKGEEAGEEEGEETTGDVGLADWREPMESTGSTKLELNGALSQVSGTRQRS